MFRNVRIIGLLVTYLVIGATADLLAASGGYTITADVAGGRSKINVGQSLFLEVSYSFGGPQKGETGKPRRDVRRRAVKIDVTYNDEDTPRTYALFLKKLSLKDKLGLKYGATYEIFYNYKAKRLIFDRPGDYAVVIRDEGRTSEPIQISVGATSKASKKARSAILAVPNAMALMLWGVGKIDNLNLGALKKIASESWDTELALKACARLGLVGFARLRKKYPSFEKWRALLREGKARGPIFDETRSYLTRALNLPTEHTIREEVIFKLVRMEFVAGHYDIAFSLVGELSEKYPNGDYGKKAAQMAKGLAEFQARERQATTAPTGRQDKEDK